MLVASLGHVCFAYPNIEDELGPRLSSSATIVFLGSAEFLVATDRDNEQHPPTFAWVVEVATEGDVLETVRLPPLHSYKQKSIHYLLLLTMDFMLLGKVCQQSQHVLLGDNGTTWRNLDSGKPPTGHQPQDAEDELDCDFRRRQQRYFWRGHSRVGN